MATPRDRILTFNDPHPMRIDRDLAAEIGLNESIVLLQLEYLISVSRNERDGRLWTYQSLEDLKKNFFPWWSLMTIQRTIKHLEEMRLIFVSSKYNRLNYDRTQWYALNPEGINSLHSVAIYQNDKSAYQNDKSAYQNDKSAYQNDTTIPESTQRLPESIQSEKRPRKSTGRKPPTQGTLDSLHEAVTIYKQLTNKHPPPTTATLIASTVVDNAAWQVAIKAWCDRGFKPGNVEGMIDWYLHPEKQQRGNTGGKLLRPSLNGHSERGKLSEADPEHGF